MYRGVNIYMADITLRNNIDIDKFKEMSMSINKVVESLDRFNKLLSELNNTRPGIDYVKDPLFMPLNNVLDDINEVDDLSEYQALDIQKLIWMFENADDSINRFVQLVNSDSIRK